MSLLILLNIKTSGPIYPEYMDRNLTFPGIFGLNLVGPKISDFISSNSHVLGPQIIIGSIKKKKIKMMVMAWMTTLHRTMRLLLLLCG
jgi:hypothetical protein